MLGATMLCTKLLKMRLHEEIEGRRGKDFTEYQESKDVTEEAPVTKANLQRHMDQRLLPSCDLP